MKYYETHYEEYLQSLKENNIHPEWNDLVESLPKDFKHMGNMLLYGPPGVGKYSQALAMIETYSPSHLKYDKKMKIQTEKHTYIYRISDIHYEIDMSLLGCNSKILWHEVFLQIVDIVSMKQDKIGIILCKQFHLIHNELLDTFYSYIQQYNHPQCTIQIRFVILTENISFLPNTILQCCKKLGIKRPSLEQYDRIHPKKKCFKVEKPSYQDFIHRITHYKKKPGNSGLDEKPKTQGRHVICNMKQLYSLSHAEDEPTNIFLLICNTIIHEMEQPNKIVFTHFRDLIYDILIYNLDVAECLWYIVKHFVTTGAIQKEMVPSIMDKTFLFLKYYNNNYRPIYHLESILFTIISKIHHYNEL
jgi:DNA polymerase III delta prime subunit